MKAMMRLGALTALLLVAMTACAAQQAAAQAPTFLLQWGSQGTGPGQFEGLRAVAVAPNGNVYTLETGSGRVQMFSGSGQYLGEWGGVGTGDGQFNYPDGITVDAAGNVYVADTENNRIQKFTATGAFLGQWGVYGFHAGQLRYPRAVVVTVSGEVYVGCGGKVGLDKFTNNGEFISEWLNAYSGPLGGVADLALDRAENVYATTTGDGGTHVDEFSPAGVNLSRFGNLPYTVPDGVAVNSVGEVYLLCPTLNQILIFGPDTNLESTLGSYGLQPGQLVSPHGIALGLSGELYVADTGNHRIQKFSTTTATPVRTTTWGQVKDLYR